MTWSVQVDSHPIKTHTVYLQHLMTEQHIYRLKLRTTGGTTDLLGLKTGCMSNKHDNFQLLLSAAAMFDCKPRVSEIPPSFRVMMR